MTLQKPEIVTGSRFHRRSVRLQGYDYGRPGAYFVTVVTAGRRNEFGEIEDGTVLLTERGRMADRCWRGIPEHFPYVTLGDFVVMPNHMHRILVLRGRAASTPPVGAHHGVPLPGQVEGFGRSVPGSLATIIRQYKSTVTRQIVQEFGGPRRLWQRSYYEHIIRDDEDWSRLHLYIEANPSRWEQDEEHPMKAGL